ncbi:MAG: EAL domain-containing protein [Eubacterium sp.]|nr:EAL domain-containing protein [Eubacterium sp.]
MKADEIEKKTLLVVEDEEINRDILNEILKDEYDLIFAEDGEEALAKAEKYKDSLSLILLDLIMPNMSGIDVLARLRAVPDYQDIPIIVASGDQSREIECLSIGASDFIQKPYPEPGVILARVHRAIELFESRKIIEYTERDYLTGLYNKEYFYSYAEQYDRHHPDARMDAIILDINKFRIINERYGKDFADEVLRKLAGHVREIIHADGGIVCRREADTFQIYCPHREDYKALLDNATTSLDENLDASSRVRLRMGVYSDVDKTLDIERRFDRAKMAADTVRDSYTRNIGVYDDTLHNAELYSMQLIEDFPEAIEQHQFVVYYQPKFDIRSDVPELCGAEALVRWNHPKLNIVSPGVFVPLFESNGLIEDLDHYVWREAARQIREWKDRYGSAVPVSINVSRVDLNDSGIIDLLLSILDEYKLDTGDLHLEVTESAYAEDADQIVEMVKRLRALGFVVEMDDFGTGYSSLNMLSTLPIDVLKLDMKFIQTAFAGEKNMDMIQIIIEIARHISAPVIAEGVETEEQLGALKELGCDIIQGYFFSPPVPAEKFEAFLTGKKTVRKLEETEGSAEEDERETSGFKSLLSWLSERYSISMRKSRPVFIILAAVIAAALFITDSMVNGNYLSMEEASEQYILARQSATELEIGSNELTADVRSFVSTGDIAYLEAYFKEADVTRRRDKAVSDLQEMFGETESEALGHLSTALSYSNELMEQEYLAMNLVLAAGDYDKADIPDVLMDYPLSSEEKALSPEEKKAQALELVYGDTYMDYKSKITENTALCTDALIKDSDQARAQIRNRLNALLAAQSILTIAMLLVVLLIVLFINTWIYEPLADLVEKIKKKTTAKPIGAEELRYVADAYNLIFDENRRTRERLTYGSMHDGLTGLYNRSAYDLMRHDLDMDHNALILVDVDKFKSVNDTYGHDVGDMVLKRVSEVLTYCFRSTDHVFRLGGDEFVVIMTNVDSSIREQVRAKIEQANVMLQKPTGDLPPTSLSVGVAFGDRENPEGDIFKDADTALYRMKEGGRCGCVIY